MRKYLRGEADVKDLYDMAGDREFLQAMEEENVTLNRRLNGFLSICNDTVNHSKKCIRH